MSEQGSSTLCGDFIKISEALSLNPDVVEASKNHKSGRVMPHPEHDPCDVTSQILRRCNALNTTTQRSAALRQRNLQVVRNSVATPRPLQSIDDDFEDFLNNHDKDESSGKKINYSLSAYKANQFNRMQDLKNTAASCHDLRGIKKMLLKERQLLRNKHVEHAKLVFEKR